MLSRVGLIIKQQIIISTTTLRVRIGAAAHIDVAATRSSAVDLHAARGGTSRLVESQSDIEGPTRLGFDPRGVGLGAPGAPPARPPVPHQLDPRYPPARPPVPHQLGPRYPRGWASMPQVPPGQASGTPPARP